MEIVIVRHAPAGDKAEWAKSGKPDAERPLTKGGRKRFSRAAKGLVRAAPKLDCIVSSPLIRALQTAELLAQEYPRADKLLFTELSPGSDYAALAKRLARLSRTRVAALVGHEPHLSGFVGWLAAADGLHLELKKGAACALDIEGRPGRGRGKLLWSLSPKLLRNLA